MLLGGSRYDQIPFTVGNQLQVGFPLRGVVGFRLNGLGFGSSFGDLLHAAFGIIEEAAVTQWAGDDGNDRQIGRASCREREENREEGGAAKETEKKNGDRRKKRKMERQ